MLSDIWQLFPCYKTVPFQLGGWAFAHGILEGSQRGNSIEILNGVDGLIEVVNIRISLGSFLHDSFEQDGILLQMFRRSSQEMAQI